MHFNVEGTEKGTEVGTAKGTEVGPNTCMTNQLMIQDLSRPSTAEAEVGERPRQNNNKQDPALGLAGPQGHRPLEHGSLGLHQLQGAPRREFPTVGLYYTFNNLRFKTSQS